MQQQKSEGAFEDSGQFTLDQKQALKKIAEYGSPYPGAWVMLFGQSATLHQAERLTIQQLSRETFFSFKPHDWSSIDFESTFFNPVSSGEPSLQALRTALWYAGIGEKRPFQLNLPGDNFSFVWDGTKLTKIASPAADSIQVTISHRTLDEGSGLPIVRSIQAAFYNSEKLKLMKSCLYTMPMKVTVDNRQIDGWSRSITHGFSDVGNPIRIFGLDSGLPKMKPPPGNSCLESYQHEKLEPLSDHVRKTDLTLEWSIVGILTAHGGYHRQGKSSEWRSEENPCELFWVKHGVVVQKEKVDLTERCVSIGLHLCADDLPTDFSGFALQESTAARHRVEALKLVDTYLRGECPDFRVLDEDWYKLKKGSTAALALGGVALKLLAGPVGLPFIIGGFVAAFHVFQGPEALCQKFEKDHEKLVADWSDLADRL